MIDRSRAALRTEVIQFGATLLVESLWKFETQGKNNGLCGGRVGGAVKLKKDDGNRFRVGGLVVRDEGGKFTKSRKPW